ncbi:uncharacterized protein LOC144138807 isoform X2 [Haemaphysalis longicornis]
MKLKKNQGVPAKPAKVGKEKKLQKPNDNDGEGESDTEDYLKVSAVTNKKPKVPGPEADSEEDDLDVDDEDLDDEDDELDEEDSLDDEELDDEESEGLSGEEDDDVPQLVAAGKAKNKQKRAGKQAAAAEEGSEDEDDEEDDESDLEDEDEEDDEEEEVAAAKAKKPSKDGANKAKRKSEDGPTEQTSKKSKLGDGIPRSIFMDVDEYDKLFLYVGNLPKGCTVEEVKALSPDIIGVRTNVKLGEKLTFAFVEFPSEAVAERNLKRLEKVKLRGHSLRVGYRGAKRADLPPTWREVTNQLCVYNLPQGLSQHRVARLFPTATQVATMAFFTLVTFENKEALVEALQNKACHSLDGHPLKFSYHLKPAGLGKKKRIRKNKSKQQQRKFSKQGTSFEKTPGGKSPKKDGEKKAFGGKQGDKQSRKQAYNAASAPTAKAKFDAKRKQVKELAAAAKQKKAAQ